MRNVSSGVKKERHAAESNAHTRNHREYASGFFFLKKKILCSENKQEKRQILKCL